MKVFLFIITLHIDPLLLIPVVKELDKLDEIDELLDEDGDETDVGIAVSLLVRMREFSNRLYMSFIDSAPHELRPLGAREP